MGKVKRKKYHKRSKRHLIINATLILILFMTIGFATINANLGILGNINLKKFSVFAKNLSYDNTNTGIDCSDAQCMLDYLGAADPVDFSTDSWATIIKAVKSGDTSSYSVGDTKTVEMGDLGTHTLRIANTTTPAECSTEGFSQTACGLVVEFTDILTLHRMNPYTNGYSNGDGNYGGWEYSEMRTYVNSTIYNSLPTELKDSIIDTYVISIHGANESSNFETIDKLYLLSPKEIKNSLNYDSAKNQTRVLDYYETADLAREYKYYDQVEDGHYYWYTRTASSNNGSSFFYVIKPLSNQMWDDGPSSYEVGVAPAFRIG